MFKDQIRIYGKHAGYLKKYSRDKQGETQFPFTVTTIKNEKRNIHIFETMIQGYMVAGMIGIIENRNVAEDSNKEIYANIMADTVFDRIKLLKRITTFMILSDKKSSLTVDGKIKRAFSIDEINDPTIGKELEGYVRGGLEIINEYFVDCKTYEDVANQLLLLIDKYSLN